ncbi:hypothetical protein HDU86_002592 [Geranomyces michiganensis]|nr:hypothetical protein HDU86_002592 [Geranomyces michiganensis]
MRFFANLLLFEGANVTFFLVTNKAFTPRAEGSFRTVHFLEAGIGLRDEAGRDVVAPNKKPTPAHHGLWSQRSFIVTNKHDQNSAWTYGQCIGDDEPANFSRGVKQNMIAIVATLKGAAAAWCLGPEGRKAKTAKANETLGPEGRKARTAKTNATLGAEGRGPSWDWSRRDCERFGVLIFDLSQAVSEAKRTSQPARLHKA